MNGKKAKMLRGLAAVNSANQSVRKYHGDPKTARTKEVLHPFKLGADGAPPKLGTHTTHTYKLNAGARVMYKKLKANYLKFLRTPNRHAATA